MQTRISPLFRKPEVASFLYMKYCDTEICLLYHATSFLFNGERGRLRKRGLAFPYHPSFNAFLKAKALFRMAIDIFLI
jgi:hypothetical protein